MAVCCNLFTYVSFIGILNLWTFLKERRFKIYLKPTNLVYSFLDFLMRVEIQGPSIKYFTLEGRGSEKV